MSATPSSTLKASQLLLTGLASKKKRKRLQELGEKPLPKVLEGCFKGFRGVFWWFLKVFQWFLRCGSRVLNGFFNGVQPNRYPVWDEANKT